MPKNNIYDSDNMINEYLCPYCGNPSLSPNGVVSHVERKHPENLAEFKKRILPNLYTVHLHRGRKP